MKKRLLILLENFEVGGAQNMVYELLRCIDRKQYDIDVLCYGRRAKNVLTDKVEKVQKIKYLELTGTINVGDIVKVFQAIKESKPDIVHAHLGGVPFAVLWGVFNRKPIIITAHTRPDMAFSSKILPLLKYIVRKNKAQVIAVSKENQELLAAFFKGSTDTSLYVNNGINIRRFYRKEHPNFTFINVGRQDENKNQIAILNAFEKIYKVNNNVRLILLGDGVKHGFLINEVKRRCLVEAITIPGNVGNTEDYYAISDCYVQSSHREALPLTAIEAMAAGLPIISTDVGGMKDIVKGNGYLIPDHSEGELYSAMVKILELNQERREDLSIESKKIVEDYSAEKMAKKYMDIYSIETRRKSL